MPAKRTQDPDDCASVWFARLERAKNLHDFERAAEAVRKLRRLGIVVTFDAARSNDDQNESEARDDS